MTILVGIDIQPIEEIEASLKEFGARYTHKLFTDYEVATCGSLGAATARCLAGRFAAKEAVLKILSPNEQAPSFKEIEVRRSTAGRPEVVLRGEAARLARRRGIEEVSLSLSYAAGIAAAAVVAQSEDLDVGPDE